MKNKTYLLNTLLIIITALGLLAMAIVHALLPYAILPQANIPNLVLLSMVVLVLEHYISPNSKRCYVCIPVFSALTFALLPLASGYAAAGEVWKLALSGCIIFTACTWLFTSMTQRISSGPVGKLAPLVSAACLCFAAQCFAGILL
ncbi:MAG: hypothetical protein Q4A66_05430 [Eubacteriales bacterium]|nr:hypothetical protein [Eubacteriales bacterium]